MQGEQIGAVTIEGFRPQMRVGLGIDQLDIDSCPRTGSAYASFQHIANPKLAADLFRGSRPIPVSKRGIARDHEHIGDPRQIARHILRDPIGKILLLAIVAQIREGQHDNRKARYRTGANLGSGFGRRT